VITTPSTTNNVPVPPATNSVPHLSVAPGVRIVKTLASPLGRAAQLGEPVVFQVHVENIGDVTLDTVPVNDVYSLSYLAFSNAVPPTADNVNDGQVTWTDVGPLAVGASTNLTATFLATAATPGGGTTNTVITAPSTRDGVPVPPATNSVTYLIDPPIDVDNVSTGAFKFVASGSINHTVLPNSSNHVLIVGISVNNTPEAFGTISNVYYGGILMTHLGTRINSDKVASIWGLLNPPVGTTNVFVRFNRAPGEGWVVGALTMRNVDQSIPYGAFSSNIGSNVNPFINGLASAAGQMIVDTVALQCTNLTAIGAGQTQRWVTNSPPVPGYATGGGSTTPGAPSVNLAWTGTAPLGNWALGAIALQPFHTLTITQSQTAVASSSNPSTEGEAVTFTATVTGAGGTPGGTVQFKIDGSAFGSPVFLVSGVAVSPSKSDLPVGPHNITAEYSGDALYLASVSPTLVQTVQTAGPFVPPPPVITAILTFSNNSFVVGWPGSTGALYTVEYTDSLTPPITWTELPGFINIPGTNGDMFANDPNAITTSRFYRVKMTY